jgi:hypothetical protein
VDRWVDGSWRRILVFKAKPIEVVVKQDLLQDNNMLQVSLVGLHLEDNDKKELRAILEKCLGIKKDLQGFYQLAKRDDKSNYLVNLFLGLGLRTNRCFSSRRRERTSRSPTVA